MRLTKLFSFVFFFGLSVQGFTQSPQIEILQSGNKISLRGLSIPSNKVIWVSGNQGTVARSIDGGNHFEWTQVQGYEKRDFRDIEAFDQNTALIMGVDAPAIILKTTNGGKTWKKVFEDSTKGMFLDAMEFKDKSNGIVIGDPIDGKVFLAETNNQGDTWGKGESNQLMHSITTNQGEAFFASSGTNIKYANDQWIFATGGMNSRLHISNSWHELPILQGRESTGANSLAVFNNKAVIVGGDFLKDTIRSRNCILVNLENGVAYDFPASNPHGYRSCVVFLSEKRLVTVGLTGIDYSKDAGKNWELISTEGFHVVQKAKKGSAVFLAGANGRIAKLID